MIKIVRAFDELPILIGQSFEGLIVQMLHRNLDSVDIAIDSAPPKGLLYLSWPMLKSLGLVLRNPVNYARTIMLSFPQLYYGFRHLKNRYIVCLAYECYAIPGPARPAFQAAFANLNLWSATRANYRNHNRLLLLLIAGNNNRPAPAALDRKNFSRHRHSEVFTELMKFLQCSPFLIVQNGWGKIADYILSWILNNNFKLNYEQSTLGLQINTSTQKYVKKDSGSAAHLPIHDLIS